MKDIRRDEFLLVENPEMQALWETYQQTYPDTRFNYQGFVMYHLMRQMLQETQNHKEKTVQLELQVSTLTQALSRLLSGESGAAHHAQELLSEVERTLH